MATATITTTAVMADQRLPRVAKRRPKHKEENDNDERTVTGMESTPWLGVDKAVMDFDRPPLSVSPVADTESRSAVEHAESGPASQTTTSRHGPMDEPSDGLTDTGRQEHNGDSPFKKYKGHRIEAPEVLLLRAKKFLTKGGADRTHDWDAKSAQLAQYLGFLEQNSDGEDWGDLLQEVIGMLKTHRVHEEYTSGNTALTSDFPVPVIPKESTRLPPVPGSLITKLPGGYRPPGLREGNHKRLSLQHNDLGIVYEPICLQDAPLPADRDPLAYTKGSAWLNDQAPSRTRHVRWEAPTYQNLVRLVGQDGDDSIGSKEDSAGLVRKGIIREAYENKTLLWRRRSGVHDGDGNVDKIPFWRRESLWAFGHPSIRPEAKRFFDINRRPENLETKKPRKKIRVGSPVKHQPFDPEERETDSTEACTIVTPEEDASGDRSEVVRYIDHAKDRWFRRPGDKFWLGNTPRQQKFVINHIRRRFEVPEPPTWGERIATFLGKKRKRDDDPEDERLRLPSPKYKVRYIETNEEMDIDTQSDAQSHKMKDDDVIGLNQKGEPSYIRQIDPPEVPSLKHLRLAEPTKGWKQWGSGFSWEKVDLAVGKVESEEYLMSPSPGLVDLERVFARIGG